LKISIVTPTLNAASYLDQALSSLRGQPVPAEHIAVDGGSNDGTVELLRDSGAQVVAEPDAGLYDAINKGIELATGDVVGFLNADDLLAPGALAAIVEGFAAHPAAQMVCGGWEVFRGTAAGIETIVKVHDRGAKTLREQDIIHGAPILNARFFRRSFLHRVGPFDPRWRRCADTDLLMRVLHLDPDRATVDPVVYLSRAHADSLTFRGGIEVDLTEEKLALCTARLAETAADPALHARYRRWHDWESAYMAWRRVRTKQPREAARALGAGLKVDPLLPVVVTVQVAQHLRMRSQHR
jgi:glycosyltransferase involved in cell wall biosynthesis